MTRDQAIQIIRRSVSSINAEKLISLLRPSLRLETSVAGGHQLSDRSHLGGVPSVPPGLQWPTADCGKKILKNIERLERLTRIPDSQSAQRFTTKLEQMRKSLANPVRPLDFLAELNFNDLNPGIQEIEGIPVSGRLLFFYQQEYGGWGFDPADRDFFRVVLIGGSQSVEPAAPTAPSLFRHCAVGSKIEWTIPNRPATYGFGEIDSASDNYQELVESLSPRSESIHRFGGYPQPVQGDMELECQLVTNGIYCGNQNGYRDPRRKILEPGAKDWRLLLQIDSDENPGWMWGDVGRLYFWIRVQDLHDQNFENVWCVQQCH